MLTGPAEILLLDGDSTNDSAEENFLQVCVDIYRFIHFLVIDLILLCRLILYC